MGINFTDIVGHERQKKILTRIVENRTLPGAILFTGASGIGKRLIAGRTIAAVFCRSENPPCETCRECLRVAGGTHPDFVQLGPNERGAIPIGSEDRKEAGTVRWLIERLSMKSFSGTTCVLVDGVDRMRIEGQNALLKTIEEPAPGTHIFLVASGTSAILPTILSRCFEMKFAPLDPSSIIGIMDKKKLINSNASVIAEISGGSAENALLLSEGDMLGELRRACRGVSDLVRGHDATVEGVSDLEKKLGAERLAGIMMNVYRQNLLFLVCGTGTGRDCRDYFQDVFLDDPAAVKIAQGAIMEARKAAARNIGLAGAVRGLAHPA